MMSNIRGQAQKTQKARENVRHYEGQNFNIKKQTLCTINRQTTKSKGTNVSKFQPVITTHVSSNLR